MKWSSSGNLEKKIENNGGKESKKMDVGKGDKQKCVYVCVRERIKKEKENSYDEQIRTKRMLINYKRNKI